MSFGLAHLSSWPHYFGKPLVTKSGGRSLRTGSPWRIPQAITEQLAEQGPRLFYPERDALTTNLCSRCFHWAGRIFVRVSSDLEDSLCSIMIQLLFHFSNKELLLHVIFCLLSYFVQYTLIILTSLMVDIRSFLLWSIRNKVAMKIHKEFLFNFKGEKQSNKRNQNSNKTAGNLG